MSVRLIALLLSCFLLPPAYAALSVGSPTMVSTVRAGRNETDYSFKARLTNTGAAVTNASAVLTSTSRFMKVIDGTLSFGDVAAGASVQSSDTFTIRLDTRYALDWGALKWLPTAQAAAVLEGNFNITPVGAAAPVTITFSPAPVTTAAINRYDWDLDGNGTFETSDTVGRNFTRSYSTPGSYQVSLRVTDSTGRQNTQTRSVVIGNSPPTVTASAQPSNGQAPLAVTFTASASDNEGIARYEWDFEGDGVYDYSSTTTGNTSHSYTAVGTYQPTLRVSDGRGLATTHAVPATVVTAAPVGSPTVTASATPASGNAPLTVNFSGTASDPQGRAFTTWAWDFQNDGVFDRTAAGAAQTFAYTAAGSYYPRLRATTSDGRSAEDVVEVTVNPNFTLSLSADTIDPGAGGTSTIHTTLGADTRASLVIETPAGTVKRTLVPMVLRSAGSYNDIWDGKDDAGNVVPEGQYRTVLLYELNGVTKRYDLALTTGGSQYNPSRTGIPSSFSPFAGQPLTVDFTLNQASEVTAFIGRYNVDTRLITFLDRQPLGRGTHRITWNGQNGAGVLVHPPSGDSFLFGIWGYTFPSNGIYVHSGVALTGLTASPSVFDPTGRDDSGAPARSHLAFTLSKPASVELTVADTTSGAVLGRIQYPGLSAGANVIAWNGKLPDGSLVAAGSYLLGLTASEANGYRAATVTTVQRVYY